MNSAALARFDISRIDKLKKLISQEQQEGNSRWYVIMVDSLRVVNKTDDVSKFDSYQQFVDDSTEKIKVLIYQSINSPNNTPHVFYPRQEESLAGILSGPDVQQFIEQKLNAQRQEFEWRQKENEYQQSQKEQERLMKELETAYQQQLQERDETIRELEQETKEMASLIEQQQATIHANSVKWGTTLATGLERFLISNAVRLQKMPLIGSLAGLFLPGASPMAGAGEPSGSDMNYEMAGGPGDAGLTESQQYMLALYERLNNVLDEQQAEAFHALLLIIDHHPGIVYSLQQKAIELAKAAKGTPAAGSTEVLT